MTILAIACTAALLIVPALAQAETAPAPRQCGVRLHPAMGETVPQNIPALVLLKQNDPGLSSTLSVVLMPSSTTLAFEQQPDPRVAGATLLIPSEPLSSKTNYALKTAWACEGAEPNWRNGSQTDRFSTGPASPLPSTIGSATAEITLKTYASSDIVITPSAELAAYLPVTMLEIYHGATPWGVSPYGASVTAGSSDIRLQVGIHGGFGASNVSLCAESDTAVHLEHMQVRAHVAGAATDPAPLEVDVPIDCTPAPVAPARPNDAGSSDTGPDDPGATNAGAVAHGGCALTTRTTRSFPSRAWLMGLVGAAIVALRRRSRCAA